MPCINCPEGPTLTDNDQQIINVQNNSGNLDEFGIPIKVGEPLSTACERTTIVGSIPEVIRHPAFTSVNGGAVGNIPSNGGIGNLVNFFLNRTGCYEDKNAQLASTCA